MNRTWRYFAAALACVAGVSLSAASQQNEKHVFVTVLDKSGAPIEGLTAEHFAIMESGRERPVVRAEPLRTPMHVAVLVDTSAMNGAPDETYRSAVADFVVRLAGFNQVALYSIGDRATPVVSFTSDAQQLRSSITSMFGWQHSRSALIDGIETALSVLEKIEAARPVIIAITSESPETSNKSAGSVIKKLVAQSVAFHAVTLATASGTTSASRIDPNIPSSSQRLQGMIATGQGDRERTQILTQGTTLTGGSSQRLTNPMALGQALGRMAKELAASYRLTFTRSGSDRIRDLQVGIFLQDVTVRATAAPFGTR